MNLLELKNCSLVFGGIQAVKDLSFGVAAGEMMGIIGPNGAGKTSLFNLLTGIYKATAGTIEFSGSPLQNTSPDAICRAGIARTFQNIRLFQNLTVLENVLVAFHHRFRSTLLDAGMKRKKLIPETQHWTQQATALLEMFRLLEKKNERACNLSYGDQRRLEIVRALATHPQLLLLDEPAAGMNPTEKKELTALIFQIQEKFGLALILIEHDMNVVMSLCPRLIVLSQGAKLAEGSPSQIRQNPSVIEAYLGKHPSS